MWWNFSGSARLSDRMPKPSTPNSPKHLKRWIHRFKVVKKIGQDYRIDWMGKVKILFISEHSESDTSDP